MPTADRHRIRGILGAPTVETLTVTVCRRAPHINMSVKLADQVPKREAYALFEDLR